MKNLRYLLINNLLRGNSSPNFQAGSRSENLFLDILLIAAIRKKLSIAKLIIEISTPLCFQILSEYPMVAHFQRAQLETLSVQQDR